MGPGRNGGLPMSRVEGDIRALVVRVSSTLCAVPIHWVLEIMRPLPVQPVSGQPAYVLGLTICRGQTAPVVHLERLLTGAAAGQVRRFVAVRAGARRALLAVDAVLGLETLTRSAFTRLPSLVDQTSPTVIDAVGTADDQILMLLRETRIVSDELASLLAHREATA